jgi:hypothetical protein
LVIALHKDFGADKAIAKSGVSKPAWSKAWRLSILTSMLNDMMMMIFITYNLLTLIL